MINADTVRALLRYSDWANEQVVSAASKLPDAKLDHSIEMGRGSLRSELLHILAGESVWLQRWQGRRETPWPNETERAPSASLRHAFSRSIPNEIASSPPSHRPGSSKTSPTATRRAAFSRPRSAT